MARIPVAELRIMTQGPGLVRVDAHPPARPQTELSEWARRAPVSTSSMIITGAALAVAGAVGVLVVAGGFMATMTMGILMTAGAGIAFMGVLKRKGRESEPVAALPPASSAVVLAERSRRVASVLDRAGDLTFERLLAQLRWTEAALLETLVVMKESGQVVEDLDLDTGEWVYRSAIAELGAGRPMTLADRQAHVRRHDQ